MPIFETRRLEPYAFLSIVIGSNYCSLQVLIYLSTNHTFQEIELRRKPTHQLPSHDFIINISSAPNLNVNRCTLTLVITGQITVYILSHIYIGTKQSLN